MKSNGLQMQEVDRSLGIGRGSEVKGRKYLGSPGVRYGGLGIRETTESMVQSRRNK